jgi:hypothetical protein
VCKNLTQICYFIRKLHQLLLNLFKSSCNYISKQKRGSDYYYHMISAHESECAMCGKYVFVSDGNDKENEKDEQLENNFILPAVVVEQIDGSEYTFDNVSCALMFKKFNAVYGSNFADQ